MIIRKAILNSMWAYRKHKKATLGTRPKRNKLIYNIKREYGRNTTGRITVRHKCRGVQRLYREVNFYRNQFDKIGKVINIEYDPNRNAFLSLIEFEDKTIEYNIHIVGVKIGDHVISSKNEVEVKPGNSTLLKYIPQGSIISCVNIRPNTRATLARSAGTSVMILEHHDNYCLVKVVRSNFIIKLNNQCMATIGAVSNSQIKNRLRYKAGQSANKGIRPTVRGVAMNLDCHPHGGGEGRSSIKRKHPMSIYCKLAKGGKTAGSRSRNNKSIYRLCT